MVVIGRGVKQDVGEWVGFVSLGCVISGYGGSLGLGVAGHTLGEAGDFVSGGDKSLKEGECQWWCGRNRKHRPNFEDDQEIQNC